MVEGTQGLFLVVATGHVLEVLLPQKNFPSFVLVNRKSWMLHFVNLVAGYVARISKAWEIVPSKLHKFEVSWCDLSFCVENIYSGLENICSWKHVKHIAVEDLSWFLTLILWHSKFRLASLCSSNQNVELLSRNSCRKV